jgi:prepilin-type N-terminal cleavage/methylation domain-containing protein
LIRRAFTLVELLVVIAIIGVLIALLLPAVQAAREAASRMNCSSNMKNVVLGFHNYADVHKALPLGGDGQNIASWAHHTLPFIEQQALYSQYNFGKNFYDTSTAAGYPVSNRNLLMPVRISVYSCPSNGDKKATFPNGQANGYRLHNVVVCFGNAGYYTPDRPSSISATNNAGRGWAPYGDITTDQGAMFWVGSVVGTSYGFKWTTLGSATDGLSNTMALSETIQGERSASILTGRSDLRGMNWWPEGGVFTAYFTPNTRNPDITNTANIIAGHPGGGTFYYEKHPIAPRGTNLVNVLSARSFHTNGVNVGIADGSVSFRSDTVNLDAWRASATSQGGETSAP